MPQTESNRPGRIRTRILTVIRACFDLIFHLLYHPFAFTYDAVAWIVSAGEWAEWRRCAIPLLPAGPVLELAHGTGTLALDLAETNRSVYALDLSPAMTRIAARKRSSWQRRHPGRVGPRLLRADATRLPFHDGCFPGAVSTFPANFIFQERLLGEIRRCLAPRGRLVVIPSAAPEWLAARSRIFSDPGEAVRLIHALFPKVPEGISVRAQIVRRPRSRVVVILVEKTPETN
jgi:ubiquinone/menaquinone biosynthesis C-methylase UbiE